MSKFNDVIQVTGAVAFVFLSFLACTEVGNLHPVQHVLQSAFVERYQGTGGEGGTSSEGSEGTSGDCTNGISLDDPRGTCTETLGDGAHAIISSTRGSIIIRSNNIPDHKVGRFGSGPGSLNPNAISPQTAGFHNWPVSISNSCPFDQYESQSINMKVWRSDRAVSCLTNPSRPKCYFEVWMSFDGRGFPAIHIRRNPDHPPIRYVLPAFRLWMLRLGLLTHSLLMSQVSAFVDNSHVLQKWFWSS